MRGLLVMFLAGLCVGSAGCALVVDEDDGALQIGGSTWSSKTVGWYLCGAYYPEWSSVDFRTDGTYQTRGSYYERSCSASGSWLKKDGRVYLSSSSCTLLDPDWDPKLDAGTARPMVTWETGPVALERKGDVLVATMTIHQQREDPAVGCRYSVELMRE